MSRRQWIATTNLVAELFVASEVMSVTVPVIDAFVLKSSAGLKERRQYSLEICKDTWKYALRLYGLEYRWKLKEISYSSHSSQSSWTNYCPMNMYLTSFKGENQQKNHPVCSRARRDEVSKFYWLETILFTLVFRAGAVKPIFGSVVVVSWSFKARTERDVPYAWDMWFILKYLII